MSPEPHWPPGWGPAGCDTFVRHERHVAAPVEAVFAHLTAIEGWPAWQRGVERVHRAGELGAGTRFEVRIELRTFDGIVGELVPPHRFGWAAVGDGLSFYQSWLLLTGPGGGTRTVFHEAARGTSALLRAAHRAELTRSWIEACHPTPSRS